jgi:hypothetical protein
MLNDSEASYAAGIVDGEGSVFFSEDGRGSGSYKPYVSVKMTSRSIPFWLWETTALGSVCTVKPWNNRCKCQYKWTVTNREALLFLEEILPYLKLKDEQAMLVCDFYKDRGKGKRLAKQLQLNVVEKVRKLNKRGSDV